MNENAKVNDKNKRTIITIGFANKISFVFHFLCTRRNGPRSKSKETTTWHCCWIANKHSHFMLVPWKTQYNRGPNKSTAIFPWVNRTISFHIFSSINFILPGSLCFCSILSLSFGVYTIFEFTLFFPFYLLLVKDEMVQELT